MTRLSALLLRTFMDPNPGGLNSRIVRTGWFAGAE